MRLTTSVAGVMAVLGLCAGCGSSTPASPSPAPTVQASQGADAHVCGTSSPVASASAGPQPLGLAQALTVVTVHVGGDVAATPAVLALGNASCIRVGAGQVVSLQVTARIPPLPAEAGGNHLLSAVTVSPAPPDGSVPLAGAYVLTFTALTAGTTALAYLPATCTLPKGVC